MKVLLSTAYWPNLHYFYYLVNSEKIFIEQRDHFIKQTFRNRTRILSANGVQDLIIPVMHDSRPQDLSAIKISTVQKWRQNHWRAITSAYGNSPYFDFFESEFENFYKAETENLLQYNIAQLQLIAKILKSPVQFSLTETFEKIPQEGILDLREVIHPKKKAKLPEALLIPYYQTFSAKFDFIPNLSILDLLFNEGLKSIDYLTAR